MLFSIKLLILGIITLALAAPTPQSPTPTDVYKRAGGIITDVICGTGTDAVRYTKEEVEKALNALDVNKNKYRNLKPQSDNGRRAYPHEFKVDPNRSLEVVSQLEKSPNSKSKIPETTYLEFPLMHDKYKGGDPEFDRVIAIVYGEQPRTYYGVHFSMVATHRGAPSRYDLVPCRPAGPPAGVV